VAAGRERVQRALLRIGQMLVDVTATTECPDTVYHKFIGAIFRGMSGKVEAVTQRPRWRKRSPRTHDDWTLDDCGIIWCPVSTPFVGDEALKAVEIIRDAVDDGGFEPDMSVSSIRERTLEINSSIVFDRADPAQDFNAIDCVQKLLEKLAAAGFYPHRLGIPTMHNMERMSPALRDAVQVLKRAWDPNNILAPGRYV
jgi:4-cresol dehydrogenase (hydroxylating)